MLSGVDAEPKLVIISSHDLDLDKRFWDTRLYEDDRSEDNSRAINALRGYPASEFGISYLEEGTYILNQRKDLH